MKNIPLIIPNFNQVSWLKGLIAQWHYYNPNQDVYILDNASDYRPLLMYYETVEDDFRINVCRFLDNNLQDNLVKFLSRHTHFDYFCISNPDIMIHPSTPENFLDIFVHCMENYGFSKVGFELIIQDLPGYIDNHQQIMDNELQFWNDEFSVDFNGKTYIGHKAPIDLTFALYKNWYPKNNRPKEWWKNGLRLFQSFHLGWYIQPDTKIGENIHYFSTCLSKHKGDDKKIKGTNTYRPKTFM